MSKPKVVVARMTPGIEDSPLWDTCDVWAWEKDEIIPKALLLEKVADIVGLYATGFDPINQELLDAAPNLRVVSNYGVGTDNIDIPACTARNIKVGNTPGVVTEATADMAFALMLSMSRRIVPSDEYVKAKKWDSWSPTLMISNDVYAKTVGIVGMGRIGQAIAKRATGFSMNILYNTRTPRPDAEAQFGAQYRKYEDLLAESDIVVMICPLTPETKHMVNDAAFDKMKNEALLINVARGPVVDPDALYKALSSGKIKAAALDVTAPEPLPADSPLLGLDNLLITPHVATGTWECRKLMTGMALGNLLNALEGKEMPSQINPDVTG